MAKIQPSQEAATILFVLHIPAEIRVFWKTGFPKHFRPRTGMKIRRVAAACVLR
jgi:hypothetical protein